MRECQSCEFFWGLQNNHQGQCRRFPPHSISGFPQVHQGWHCGEFQPKLKVETKGGSGGEKKAKK